jgi:hypothetical protein
MNISQRKIDGTIGIRLPKPLMAELRRSALEDGQRGTSSLIRSICIEWLQRKMCSQQACAEENRVA